MNKNRFTEFFKGKGYYVLLFVGVVAIAAVAIIGSRLSSTEDDGEDNYVDLNETDDNLAAGEEDKQLAENTPVSDGLVNNGSDLTDDTITNDIEQADGDDGLLEYEGDAYTNEGTSEPAQADVKDKTAEEEAAATVETTGSTVQTDKVPAAENLNFSADDTLTWPVSGNVIMNYSMDHTIFFATLMQYKCNPAIIIDAEVGTEVKAAAKGIVSSLDANNEETGYTITMDIGDGYSVVYGQLDKDSVSFKVGDVVKEGDVIGKVAEPTKYYTVEGSNLYFKVLANDQTVNPMLYLR